MNYKLVIDNPEKGIAIMVDSVGCMSAYVNGKHYSVITYRPIFGDGRQLREDSQKAIREMIPTAEQRIREMEEREQAERESLRLSIMEECRKEVTPAPKTFGQVLEESFITTLTEKSAGDMVDRMYPTLEKMLVEKFGMIPKIHEIRIPERKPYQTKEVLHKDFDRIVSMIMDNEPVYLCGPAGTGKSYLAKQVAEALGLDYYYTNSVTDDIMLKGFIDANGRYHETQFYHAFVNGGVFLLDELDASVPETLVLLNNALANGYFNFPNGKASAHKDFRCIAAGNTYGTGADNTYTGRYQLDASSMDRFASIHVGYDDRIALSMCGEDNDLVNFANDFRSAVDGCGITCLCTYRAIKRLHKFVAYMSKEDALRIALVKGLPADDIRMIHNKMVNKDNPWAVALLNVAKR